MSTMTRLTLGEFCTQPARIAVLLCMAVTTVIAGTEDDLRREASTQFGRIAPAVIASPEVSSLVAFLQSLTGEVPAQYSPPQSRAR